MRTGAVNFRLLITPTHLLPPASGFHIMLRRFPMLWTNILYRNVVTKLLLCNREYATITSPTSVPPMPSQPTYSNVPVTGSESLMESSIQYRVCKQSLVRAYGKDLKVIHNWNSGLNVTFFVVTATAFAVSVQFTATLSAISIQITCFAALCVALRCTRSHFEKTLSKAFYI
jgi:hypothetical protein